MSNNPADLKYTKDHEWARIEGELVRIGITLFAVEQLGDVTLVDLPKPGTKIVAGTQFGAVESVKAVSELYAPVSGEVVELNEKLTKKPELVNEAPYKDGWMLVVRPSNRSQLDELLDSGGYDKYLGALQPQ